MILETQFKIGDVVYKAQIEGEDMKECLFQAGTVTGIRRKCDVCGKTEGFRLVANKADTFKFVNIECSCGAKSNLGSYKDGSGFYWKNFERFDAQEVDQKQFNKKA